MRSRKLASLGALAAVAVVSQGTAQAATGSGSQVVTGTLLSAITVTPVPVTLSGMTAGSSAATGSGNVVVVSTDCYDLSVADPTNLGYLKFGSVSPIAKLQWKVGTGSFADLSGSSAPVVSNQAVSVGRTHSVSYNQPLTGDNLAAGAYTTTATFTAQSSTC